MLLLFYYCHDLAINFICSPSHDHHAIHMVNAVINIRKSLHFLTLTCTYIYLLHVVVISSGKHVHGEISHSRNKTTDMDRRKKTLGMIQTQTEAERQTQLGEAALNLPLSVIKQACQVRKEACTPPLWPADHRLAHTPAIKSFTHLCSASSQRNSEMKVKFLFLFEQEHLYV